MVLTAFNYPSLLGSLQLFYCSLLAMTLILVFPLVFSRVIAHQERGHHRLERNSEQADFWLSHLFSPSPATYPDSAQATSCSPPSFRNNNPYNKSPQQRSIFQCTLIYTNSLINSQYSSVMQVEQLLLYPFFQTQKEREQKRHAIPALSSLDKIEYPHSSQVLSLTTKNPWTWHTKTHKKSSPPYSPDVSGASVPHAATAKQSESALHFSHPCDGGAWQGSSETIIQCKMVLHFPGEGVSRAQGKANCHPPSCDKAMECRLHFCQDGGTGAQWGAAHTTLMLHVNREAACSKREIEQDPKSHNIIHLGMSRIEQKLTPYIKSHENHLGYRKKIGRHQYREEQEAGTIKNLKAGIIKMLQ